MDRLTVLITNIVLDGRTGTEVMTRNVALALQARGHAPIVYSPVLGEIAAELQNRSIPVVQDLAQIRRPVDVIHGHHLPTTLTATAFFPTAPVLFFCHDFLAWHDVPPHLPSIYRYVAVDRTVYDRFTIENGIPPEKALVLLNPVDIERFQPGPALNDAPASALAFAKNQAHVEIIKAVCRSRGLPVSFIGAAVDAVADRPENIVPGHDIVFASALSAMEAMACGRAVIVCDGRGLAGFCTQARYDEWRAFNFGLRTLKGPLTFEAIAREIDAYDPAAAAAVARRLRAEGGMAAYAVRLEALYGEALEARASGAVSTDRDLLRSLGSELQRFCARRDGGPAWLSERRTLIETVDRLAIGVESARLGEWVQFCAPETRRFWQPAAGFSTVEPWGIWTDGAFASVMTRLPTGADRRVTFRLRPFLPDADKRQLVVEVFGNGLPLASWRFDNAQECDQVVTVPATLLTEGAPFWFGFRIDRPCSPQALNLSPDARLLGVGFLSMIIEAQDSPPSATPLPPIQRPSETPRRGILRALFSRRRRQ